MAADLTANVILQPLSTHQLVPPYRVAEASRARGKGSEQGRDSHGVTSRTDWRPRQRRIVKLHPEGIRFRKQCRESLIPTAPKRPAHSALQVSHDFVGGAETSYFFTTSSLVVVLVLVRIVH